MTGRRRFELLEGRRLLAVLVVTTQADAIVTQSGDAPGTLRQAIFDSNASPGDDVVEFSSDIRRIVLEHGELNISDDVEIRGDSQSMIEINGNDSSRQFNIGDGVEVRISNLALENGASDDDGGSIYSRGSELNLQNVLVRNSLASGEGGAVSVVSGTVSIADSWFSENSARAGGAVSFDSGVTSLSINTSHFENNESTRGGGGGLSIDADSTTIDSTTIHGNRSSGDGGGIDIGIFSGSVNVMSSTLSGNTAGSGAGGIAISGASVRIAHSTVFENYSTDRLSGTGGIRVASGGSLVLDHAIVADNQASHSRSDLRARNSATIDATFSLIGSNSDTDFLVASPDNNGNLVGSANSPIDPMLSTLANAGTKSRVHIPAAGSPAVNAGKSDDGTLPNTDQRGGDFVRVTDGQADIGAVERQWRVGTNYLVDTVIDEFDGDFSAGDLSLREAVGLANIDPMAREIRFAPSMAGKTIQLEQGQLSVAQSTSILGWSDHVTIDGGKKSRVLSFTDGDLGTNQSVALAGVRVTNGHRDRRIWGDGGGVFSLEDFRMSDSEVVRNGAWGDGNGVFAASLRDRASFTNVRVIQNRFIDRDEFAQSHGGGLHGVAVGGGNVFISDSLFVENDSIGSGGLHLVAGANSTVGAMNSYVRRNDGTGIRAVVQGGELVLDNLNSIENKGNGLYLDASDSELNTIKSVTIANNVLDRDFASGGGVFALLVNSTANFMDSTISGNSSSGDGGGVYFRARGNGSLNFVGSTIADNIGNRRFDNEINGGGIVIGDGALPGSSITLDRSIVANNYQSLSESESMRNDLVGESLFSVSNSLISAAGESELSSAPVGNPDENGNLVGTRLAPIDPMLSELGYHGGRTLTRLLLDGSPAIDAGGRVVGKFDQRGMPYVRTAGEAVDMGSTESGTGVVYGDVDGNQEVTAEDVNELCSAIWSGPLDLETHDLNYDRRADADDVMTLIDRILGTVVGDVNLDGVFNSTDFVEIFRAGEFEDGRQNNSTYTEGDWNCDGDFGTRDFVHVFQLGTYSANARPNFYSPSADTFAAARIFPLHEDASDERHRKRGLVS